MVFYLLHVEVNCVLYSVLYTVDVNYVLYGVLSTVVVNCILYCVLFINCSSQLHFRWCFI